MCQLSLCCESWNHLNINFNYFHSLSLPSLSYHSQPVGCDGVLGSRKAIDKCGRCITPDETCTRNSGTKTQDPVIGENQSLKLCEILSMALSVLIVYRPG